MRLAILGAGAIGPACAALAASRGHTAVLWSPSGAGTRGIDATLHAEGLLEGSFPVSVAARLAEAFAGADAALLTVPAYALPDLLPRIAAEIPTTLPLLIAPAASLAPLAFARLRGPGARGRRHGDHAADRPAARPGPRPHRRHPGRGRDGRAARPRRARRWPPWPNPCSAIAGRPCPTRWRPPSSTATRSPMRRSPWPMSPASRSRNPGANTG